MARNSNKTQTNDTKHKKCKRPTFKKKRKCEKKKKMLFIFKRVNSFVTLSYPTSIILNTKKVRNKPFENSLKTRLY